MEIYTKFHIQVVNGTYMNYTIFFQLIIQDLPL